MKIISKFKDYYDYKVAEYGIDENLVYDRRNGTIVDRQRISPEESNLALYSTLYVGSEVVHLFITQNKIYTHFDLVDIEEKKRRYYFFIAILKFKTVLSYSLAQACSLCPIQNSLAAYPSLILRPIQNS